MCEVHKCADTGHFIVQSSTILIKLINEKMIQFQVIFIVGLYKCASTGHFIVQSLSISF